MKAKYKLIEIGRMKVTREVEVTSEAQLLREVKKHLVSNDVELSTDDDGQTFIVCAGMRTVGKVEKL